MRSGVIGGKVEVKEGICEACGSLESWNRSVSTAVRITSCLGKTKMVPSLGRSSLGLGFQAKLMSVAQRTMAMAEWSRSGGYG